MTIKLAENEALLQVGVRGIRGPGGEVVRTEKLYIIVPDESASPDSGLTEGEEKTCRAAALSLLPDLRGKRIGEI